ncbi:S26 family signal peptidase [Aquamicrobium segne]|uniref:S26 family signal peptidase n=1 Tax=Aquamicrobium segne TaxID=469547 RepID=A0ABW0H476_9HYPH
MIPRRYILLTMLCGASLVVVPALTSHAPRLIFNASASVPVGLYSVHPVDEINVGDLVAVLPPDDLAVFLDARGYLPRGVPLIKRVLALPGTEVCRRSTTVIAYDHAYGDAQPSDSFGRDLPQWQGCRTLGDDEVFLMNWDAADSLDGRYFGPLPRASITARVTPLYTDEYGDGHFRWRFTDPALEP